MGLPSQMSAPIPETAFRTLASSISVLCACFCRSNIPLRSNISLSQKGKLSRVFFLGSIKEKQTNFKKRQHSLRQTHLRLFYCLRQQHPKPNLVEQGNLSAQYWNLSLEACFFVRYTKNKSFKPQSFEQIEETSPFLIGKPHLGNIHRKDETRYDY